MMTNGKETDMTILAPSILSADFSALGDQVSAAEAGGADLLHIDVMDGHFVPNISFGSAVMKSLNGKTGLQYDVHLMIEDPDRYIEDFVTGQTEYITVHQEACRHLHRTVQHIRSAGVKAGVAINPATPVESLSEIAEDTGLILIMSVNPGFGGQAFLDSQLEKIRRIKAMIGDRDIKIEIDGGINPMTAAECISVGADILVAGTSVFAGRNFRKNIEALR